MLLSDNLMGESSVKWLENIASVEQNWFFSLLLWLNLVIFILLWSSHFSIHDIFWFVCLLKAEQWNLTLVQIQFCTFAFRLWSFSYFIKKWIIFRKINIEWIWNEWCGLFGGYNFKLDEIKRISHTIEELFLLLLLRVCKTKEQR